MCMKLPPEDLNPVSNQFFFVPHLISVGSQIAAHTLMETGNGPNEPNTINL